MRFFTPALGFDDIARINVLDGVRIYFRNGDIAHIRPSGNAPQLRLYANSDSQARANQIVELGLREPDGILRQLERAFTPAPS
jgi:phosphomannomutase